jgi:hypothetical protein
MLRNVICVASALCAGLGVSAGAVRAQYATEIEIENTTPEKKTDWPVIVNVYQVLGRNIPAGSLNPKGYHVYDEKGEEIPHDIEAIPPYDVESNNELVFVVPAISPGQKLVYRVTNTAKDSARRTKIDVVNSPHNLIRNPGFEKGDEKSVAEYEKGAVLDTAVKRSGKASLLIKTTRWARVGYAHKVKLHRDSPYYVGVWARTENVARRGLYAGRGAYVALSGGRRSSGFRFVNGYAGVRVQKQCYTRDWNKCRFFSRYGIDFDDWGVYRNTALATTDSLSLSLYIDQRKQFVMEKGKYEGKWWLDDFVLIEQPKKTVRFDKTVEPLMKDSVFVFTRPVSALVGLIQRDKDKRSKKTMAFCSFPFAHEAAKKLDMPALRGQRIPYLVGLYHTRELKTAGIEVEGGALAGPGGAKIPVESIEYSHGYLQPVPTHLLMPYEKPVDFKGERGVRYFLVSVKVPEDARPGRYTATVKLAVDGAQHSAIPLTLRVQDLVLAELEKTYVGYIFQGTRCLNEEGLKQYAKSGFSGLTVFGGFLPYKKTGDHSEVDLDALDKKMTWLKNNGIHGICLYSEIELDPQWGPGRLWRKSGGTKESYQREIKRIEAARKKHPDWPELIYMIWDEPMSHGGIQPKLGWVNEVAPKALTTLDCEFKNLPKAIKYINMPCIDNPADCVGPELFKWFRDQGKEFGYCGKATNGECTRYQMGIHMATSGARLQQPWHLENHRLMSRYKQGDKRVILRSIGLASCGRGCDDLKVYRLLQAQMKAAEKKPDKAEQLKAAKEYLAKIFSVWDGDTAHVSQLTPYLGWASTWGYEQFYDDWQEQMARHAAALKGVEWVE